MSGVRHDRERVACRRICATCARWLWSWARPQAKIPWAFTQPDCFQGAYPMLRFGTFGHIRRLASRMRRLSSRRSRQWATVVTARHGVS